MKHIVCLTKTYVLDDFKLWYKYHKKMGYIIHIIDNESPVNIKAEVNEIFGDTYQFIAGWPNQWQLYDDILKFNRYDFKQGEYIAFIDDDEYIWYYNDYWKKIEENDNNYIGKDYEILEEYLDSIYYNMKDNLKIKENELSICMPQILMSTQQLQDNRKKNLIELSLYRRNDISSQSKCFIKYDYDLKYKFNTNNKENGHIPFINDKRISIVGNKDITKTTYAEIDYKSCLRLYHYHIKSKEDWNYKYLRGSAAVNYQWYDKDITKNLNYDGYKVPDFTMINTKMLYNL